MIIGGLQARSGSHRLPGKIYMDLKGESLLERAIKALRGLTPVAHILAYAGDTQLIEYCIDKNLPMAVLKADEDDVLTRYVRYAAHYPHATHVVRRTADCPVPSTAMGLSCIIMAERMGMDFVSYSEPTGGRDGDDTEVVSTRLLTYLDQRVNMIEHREHVTSYVYTNQADLSKDFRIHMMKPELNESRVKTSIDTEEDLERVRGMLP